MHPVMASISMSDLRGVATRPRRRIRTFLLRQDDGEYAALSGKVVHSKSPPVQRDGLATDRQPEPQTRPIPVLLSERLEELLGLAFGQAAALILDFEHDVLFRITAPHPNGPVLLRVFDRILH